MNPIKPSSNKMFREKQMAFLVDGQNFKLQGPKFRKSLPEMNLFSVAYTSADFPLLEKMLNL